MWSSRSSGVVVELGYDRSIPAWEAHPGAADRRTLDPGKVASDLVDAVGEGITNAAALIGALSAAARSRGSGRRGSGTGPWRIEQNFAGAGQPLSRQGRPRRG